MHSFSDGKNWEEVPFGNNSWKEIIFDGSVFWPLENNGYLGESTDGVIWKSIGIKGWIKAIMAHIVKKQGML